MFNTEKKFCYGLDLNIGMWLKSLSGNSRNLFKDSHLIHQQPNSIKLNPTFSYHHPQVMALPDLKYFLFIILILEFNDHQNW